MTNQDLQLLRDIYEHFDGIADGAPDASYAAKQALSFSGPLKKLIDNQRGNEMNITHPTVNPETGECGDPACPCHELARIKSTHVGHVQTPAPRPYSLLDPSEGSQRQETPDSTLPTLANTPDFESEWALAPRTMTNYVERDIAEYWFLRGMRAGEVKALTESTATFRAMAEQRRLGR